ncbi:GNAT family N-acetyltransferase [Methylorubrum thiocyanatum]|uniref:GNAT family N-acetyltransferase n=1 Tax=Methylorubrum thiocyanatum TaxID=47958 RepID=UPI003839DCF6
MQISGHTAKAGAALIPDADDRNLKNGRRSAYPAVQLARAPGAWSDPALAGAAVTVFPSVDAAESVWRETAATGACTVFQCFEWLATWRRTAGTSEPLSDQIVHVSSEAGQTLMLLPLAIRRNAYGRSLEFLGGDLTDYNMPILAAGFSPGPRDAERLWAAILDVLPPVDFVRLRRMPLVFDGIANPFAGLAGSRHVIDAYGANLPPTFKDFTTRSPSFFNKNSQRRRRLAKEGAVRFAVAQDPAERVALTRFVIEQKSQWQRDTGQMDTFAAPERLAFYTTLAGLPFEEGGVVPVGLWVGSELVAGIWGTVFRGRFAVIVAAYHQDWAKFSVARLLMESAVEMCIARDDVAIFDLTVGDEGYKTDWSDHSLPLHEVIAPHSLRGRMFMAYWHLRGRAKTVPWLRDAVRSGMRLAQRVSKRD